MNRSWSRLLLTRNMKPAARNGENLSLCDLRAQNSDTWNLAYEALWQVAWRSAKRKLPYDSPEQLEDLISTVVSREIVPQILTPSQSAFREAKNFDDVLNLTSRIVSNRAIDEIRRRVRRPDLQNIERTPEREVVRMEETEEIAEDIHLALESLENRYRDVIVDFYFEELNTEEIALKRDRPKGSICSDLVKARELLGSVLSPNLLQTSLS